MTKSTPTPRRAATGGEEASDAAVRAAYRDGAAEQLAAQAQRVRRAKATVRREQAKLDRMIAESVSSQPAAVTWYARPGALDLAGAAAAIERSELAVHRAVERHRNARATKPARR